MSEGQGTPEPTRQETVAGREAADALKALLARVADIFGVFDLSFVVSGAVCLAALAFAAGVFGGWDQLRRATPVEWKALHAGAAVLASYVLGIVCFAAGRKLRQDARFYTALPGHLRDFGLDEHYARFLPQAADADGARRCSLLYARLWAEVRQTRHLAPSFNLVTRYWVMAAMCDGLSAAFALWSLLWMAWALASPAASPPPGHLPWIGAVACAGAAVLSSIEAQRYGKAQMYELCATLAHEHASAVPNPPGG